MSNWKDVTLRGHAVAFNQCGWVGSPAFAEIMDPRAFDAQLAADVFLNFNSHDDSPVSRRVSIFRDSYGLGFDAKVDLRDWMWLCRPMAAYHNQCSIYMIDRVAKPERLTDGTPAERVTRASIEHITITDSPCHPRTAIWAMIHDEPPPRFREVNEQWKAGRAAFLLGRRRAQLVAAHAARRADSATRCAASRPSSPEAFLLSRREEHLRVLSSILAGAGRGGFAAIGHAALSKKA
jgi:phage head maturation protease